jgi:hypothetical protein
VSHCTCGAAPSGRLRLPWARGGLRSCRVADSLKGWTHLLESSSAAEILAVSDPNGPGTQAAGSAEASAPNFSTRYCALHPTAHINSEGKLRLVRELLKKRRQTEVSVLHSGSAGAIGRHNSILKIDLCSCTRMRLALAFCRHVHCLRRAFPRLVVVLF